MPTALQDSPPLVTVARLKNPASPASPVAQNFPVIAMAASVGGLNALSVIVSRLPADFPAVIAMVMPLSPDHKSSLEEILNRRPRLDVKQAQPGDILCRRCVLVAPSERRLSDALGGRRQLCSLAAKELNDTRLAAEPLAGSVAAVYQRSDFSQERSSAKNFCEPQISIRAGEVDFILALDEIPATMSGPVATGHGPAKHHPSLKTPALAKQALPTLRRTPPGKAVRSKIPAAIARPAPAGFPIVGIGASAGGPAPMDRFPRRVPAGSGMAFGIVQHLDPTRNGLMIELRQRVISMIASQVEDRNPVRPAGIGVIQPKRDISALHSFRHLLKPTSTCSLRLPIAFFFPSLAQDQHEHRIGVILSGRSSEGTRGLQAFKKSAGAGLVQEPATARFDSMPRRVIDAGLADSADRAEELPGKILAYLHRTPMLVRSENVREEKKRNSREKVVILRPTHAGHDFFFSRRNNPCRQVERCAGIHQIKKMPQYVHYRHENSQQPDLLPKGLLIGGSNCVCDPATWEQLAAKAFRILHASRPAGRTFRGSVSGCSTREAAYNLSMLFKEAFDDVKSRGKCSTEIFATDLDRDAIEKARPGIFSVNNGTDISEVRLNRFFIKEESGHYRVRKEIRKTVNFVPLNVIINPPSAKLDDRNGGGVIISANISVIKTLEGKRRDKHAALKKISSSQDSELPPQQRQPKP